MDEGGAILTLSTNAVLSPPEGFVPTTMYMNGTLRSWIHYWETRCTPETQKEHYTVAWGTREVILPNFPIIAEALGAT